MHYNTLGKTIAFIIVVVWITAMIVINPTITETYVPSECGNNFSCPHDHPACIKYTRIIDDGIGICCESCTKGWGYCPPPLASGIIILPSIIALTAIMYFGLYVGRKE